MGGSWLRLAALLALGSLAAALSPAEEAAALLALPKAITNWDAALADPACQATPGVAWSDASPPCGDGTAGSNWRGVTCNAEGQITELHLSFCGLEGPLPAELASLGSLQVLDLQHNRLRGGVPDAWTAIGAFPALQTLNLAYNRVEGGLDDLTPVATGMIASEYFNVTGNALSQSTIPAGWYSKTLQLIAIGWNNISGPLPAEWGYPKEGHEAEYPSAFPQLARLQLEGNNISGPFDPWPGGGAHVFSPDFLCTGKPGNPYMLKLPPPPALDSGGGGLSTGAIVGIAVGCAAGVALLALAALLVVRRRRRGPGAKAAPGLVVLPGAPGSGVVVGGGAAALYGSDVEKGSSEAKLSSGPSTAGSLVEHDTDTQKLPEGWNTVDFSELELSTRLGQGSFGAVWLAKYCQTTVAVKVLGGDKVPGATDSTHQASITRQLKKEAGIMSKLRHTNICLYMGACAEPPCMLMEYCAKKSLDDLVAQGLANPAVAKQLRWPRLLAMLLDAAKGMLYLHSRASPIVHRDLKSANLLVTSQYQVKVADFNLSRTLESSELVSTLCVQNPRWLAPEVLAGQPGGLPADVWAFGTVMWEVATWHVPFEGVNAYQIINTVQAAERGSGLAVPVADALPAGPLGEYEQYVALMEACWERDPARRPAFEEVVERLRGMLGKEVRRLGSGQLGSSSNLGGSFGPSPAGSLPQPSAGTPTVTAPRLPPSLDSNTTSGGSAQSPFAHASQPSSQGGGSAGAAAAPPVSPFAAAQ